MSDGKNYTDLPMDSDPQIHAFDMAMRVLMGSQVTCGCGIGPDAVTAVTMHVLGAVSSMAGLDETALAEDSFWEGFRVNFTRGFLLHRTTMEAVEGGSPQ